jgi:hypothetical protein
MCHKAGACDAVIHAQAAGVEGFDADAHLVARGVIPEKTGGAQLGWPVEMFPITEAQIHLIHSEARGGGLSWSVMAFNHSLLPMV